MCTGMVRLVDRVYTWTRTATTGTMSTAGRVRWGSDLVSAPFTLERTHFDFVIRQQFTESSGASPPASATLRAGVIVVNSALGAPDYDVTTNPTADWIWAGLFMMRRLARSGYTGVGFDLGWWSDGGALDTASRRAVGGTASYRVYVVTTPLPVDGDGVRTGYLFTAQLAVLTSVPG